MIISTYKIKRTDSSYTRPTRAMLSGHKLINIPVVSRVRKHINMDNNIEGFCHAISTCTFSSTNKTFKSVFDYCFSYLLSCSGRPLIFNILFRLFSASLKHFLRHRLHRLFISRLALLQTSVMAGLDFLVTGSSAWGISGGKSGSPTCLCYRGFHSSLCVQLSHAHCRVICSYPLRLSDNILIYSKLEGMFN